jgi:L-malate glycosyltransferase
MSPLGPPFGWGGSENFWFDAVPVIVDAGWHVDVLLRRDAARKGPARALEAAGANVLWNEMPPSSDVARVIGAIRRRLGGDPHDRESEWWNATLAAARPDLVWFNLPSFGDLAAVHLPARILTQRVTPYWIVLQHAHEHLFPTDDDDATKIRATLATARRNIFIAEHNRRSVERAIGMHLPNAWSSANSVPDEFLSIAAEVASEQPPRDSGPVTMLNLARIDPLFKGQHILLEVLAEEPWVSRDWRLLLAGGGRLTETVQRLIGFYGVDPGRVDMLGYCDDVLSVIQRSDLSVMPSLSEGSPFAAIETMAGGRPIIATPVGGLPELVAHGETGWISRSTEVADFADAMEQAWSERARWAEVGRAAAAYVRAHHASSTVHSKLVDLLQQDARVQTA